MVTIDELKKKSQQQQQQQQQQDDKKVTANDLKSKLWWNTSEINAAQTLEDSLKDAEKHTAFSVWHIKDIAESAWDWFSDIWHSVTDKDEKHWILDYSEYKKYKDILDSAPLNDVDVTAVYQQMANEWVIDYNKFTQWFETEWSKEQGKYYKYDKAVDAIKTDFDTKLSDALQPFMSEDRDSYQINALTKAREVMNSQVSMFIDWYASTYKSTRDADLLKDFNKILDEYETSIIEFTKQWADNLTTKWEGWAKAYYDTLDDKWMRDYAQNIRSIQFKTENKLTEAAMLSNFWDSWTAFKNGNLISSVSELLWWAMNWVNWILDKFIGNPTEYVKNATIGWYDVVEELANLNVYSNDAWALEKTFGTMASWVWDILDAAPTLVPMIADIVVWSKAGIIGKADNVSDMAMWIDKAIWKIYKNANAVKNIAKEWDIILNAWQAWNLWKFPLQMLSRYLENKFIFDVAAQQFEGNPITDDMLVYNFLINLPVDTFASLLPEWSKLIAKSLSKKVLINDNIDKEVFDMLAKHYNWFKKVLENWDKAQKEYDSLTKATDKIKFDRSAMMAAEEARRQWQEKYYMAQSLIERRGWTSKKTVNLNDAGLDEWLVNFIRQVQKDSQDVYERLSTFQGNVDDYLQEMQARLTWAQKKALSLETIVKQYSQQLKNKSTLWKARWEHSVTISAINYLETKLNQLDNWREILTNALAKVFKWDEPLKDLIEEMIFKSNNEWKLMTILKKANDAPSNQMSYDEMWKKINEVMSSIIKDNPNLIEVWDAPLWWWVKQENWMRKHFLTWKEISEEDLLKEYWKDLKDAWVVADSYQLQLNSILNDIAWNKRDAFEISNWEVTKLSSSVWWKEPFFDVTKDLDTLWINLNRPKWQWKKWDLLAKNDPSATVYNDIYNNVWLRIVDWPNGISIYWTEEAVRWIRDNILSLNKITDDTELSAKELATYNFLFAKDLEWEVNRNIKAINNYQAKSWKKLLTAQELVSYAHWHKSFVEDALPVKETKLNNAEKWHITKAWTWVPDKKAWTKLSKKNTNRLKKQISKTVKWEATHQETEQVAAKLITLEEATKVINEVKSTEKELHFDLSVPEKLSKKFQKIFEWHWTTEWSDEARKQVKRISDTFANVITNIMNGNMNKMFDAITIEKILDMSSDALWTLMISPLTLSTMEDWGEELMYGLISTIFLKGWDEYISEAWWLLFNTLDNLLGKVIDWWIWFEWKKAGHQIYQIRNALANVANNISKDPKTWLQVIQVTKSFRDALCAKLTPYVKTLWLEDFRWWKEKFIASSKKLLETKIKPDRLKEIIIWDKTPKVSISLNKLLEWKAPIDVSKLNDNEIDLFAQAIANEQLRATWLYSERLYNNIYNSTKEWLSKLREDNQWIPVKINLNAKADSYYMVDAKKPYINYSLLSDVQMLWAVDDKMIYENTLAHELWHWKIHKEAELVNANKADTEMWILNTKWYYWLYWDYIQTLRKVFSDTINRVKKWLNKETKMSLSNYFTKYDLKEYTDSLIKLYNKDNLINTLVEAFEKWEIDRFKNARVLWNIMWENKTISTIEWEMQNLSTKNVLLLEEYINELNTFALAWRLDKKWMKELSNQLWYDVEEQITKALDTMDKASEVIDRFRYFIASKWNISPEELRAELWYIFDEYSINIAKNKSDKVAEKLLKWVEWSKNPKRVVKALSDIGKKIDITINKEDNFTKRIFTIKKELIAKLSNIENNAVLQTQYWLSAEEAKSIRETIEWINREQDLTLALNDLNIINTVPKSNKTSNIWLSHQREVYFLDIWETNLDIQYSDTILDSVGKTWDEDWITPTFRRSFSANNEAKVWAKAISQSAWWIKKWVSSQVHLRNTAKWQVEEMLKYKINQAVPVIKSLATMWEDLWSFGTDALGILTKLVWDIDKSIDMNKLLVWEETIKAYQEYVKTHNVSFWTFVVNKLFANVLWEMKMYNEKTIAMINAQLKNAQYDAVKSSISWPYNKYSKKFFEQIFDRLKETYYIERGIWTPIKDTSEIWIHKREPKLTRAQWEEAFKEWKDSDWNIKTIWEYYNFSRNPVNFKWEDETLKYSVDWVHKQVDLKTYEWYSQYYDDWEIPMVYTEWERWDIDVNEVLKWATEEEMKAFNNAVYRYIDAVKNNEWVEDALDTVEETFMVIINDAWSASHSNFRFMSVTWTPLGFEWEKEWLAWLHKLRTKIPSRKANNIAKKYIEWYKEKPVGIKKPNSAEELILSIAKWLIDSEWLKVWSDELVLSRIAEQLVSKEWTLNEYWEEIEYLVKQINDIYKSLMDDEIETAAEADELIDGIWLDFVSRWNKKIANELWIEDKWIRYDKAEEKSMDTLEFLKSMSNDNIQNEQVFSLESMSDVWELAEKENFSLKENPLDEWVDELEKPVEWEVDLYWWAVEWNVWYWWAEQTIRDKIWIILPDLVEKDLDNYKLLKDSNAFEITEKWIDEQSKWLTVNMGIVYNWLENTKKFDEQAEEWLKYWRGQKDKIEKEWKFNISKVNWQYTITEDNLNKLWIDDWYNIFGKLTSYANWNFVNWNIVKTMNMYWVNSVLWKTIGWEKVNYVQVVLKDWQNILFSNKWKKRISRFAWESTCDWWKTLVRFSTSSDDLAFTRSLYNSLLWENWWVEVRMLDKDWNELSFATVWTEDVWRSFIWDEISNYLWLWNANKTRLDKVNSSVLYNTVWLKGWGSKKVNYNDISKVTETLWWDTVSLNNESMMQLLHQRLNKKIENISVSGFLARRWKEEVPQSYLDREEAIRKVRDELRSKMENAWYKVDTNWESLVNKITSLEINAQPLYYNKDWTPFALWSVLKWWREASVWKHIKVVKEYPNWVIKTEYIPAATKKSQWKFWESVVEEVKEEAPKSYYVKVDSNWKEIPDTKEYLENKYRPIWVKVKVDTFDEDWNFVKSFYLNWNRKWWFIPIDNTTNIDSETFWNMVDNRILESEMEWKWTLWLTWKVNKEDWEMIVVLANDEWMQAEAMIKQIDDIYTSENTTYRWYYLYFNADNELWLWMADNYKTHNFNKEYKKSNWIDLSNIDWDKAPTVDNEALDSAWLSKWQKSRIQIITDKILELERETWKPILKENNKLRKIARLNPVQQAKEIAKLSKQERIEFYQLLEKSYKEELDNVALRLEKAKELWDLSENAEYQAALDYRDLFNAKINNLHALIWKVSNEWENSIDILKDSSFVNGDNILIYDYRMPLVYNKWAKKAEELWLFKDDAADLAEKWHWWWKDSRKVMYKTYENWKEKWVYWEFMDKDAYENFVREEKKAKQLLNQKENWELKLEEPKLEEPETPVSMADIIDFTPNNDRRILEQMLDDDSVEEETKKFIRDEFDLKKTAKTTKEISDTNVTREIYSSSDWLSEIFSFTNMDVLWWNTVLSQLRWANADFKRIYWDRLIKVWSEWNKAFGSLTKTEQENLIKWINSKVNTYVKDWNTIIEEVFTNPTNRAEELVNDLAKIFAEAKWNNAYILNKIHNADSLDNLIYKTFNTYQNVSLWMFSNLKNTDDVREFVFNAAKSMWTKDKRAFNLAKDWVWDPLSTWPFMNFLANVRSAYRFAKYSLLSPVSWTLMYLNSAVMSEPLLWAKKSWLWLYYWSNDFKKLVQEQWVTNWLERDSDLIFQWANWMQMNWIATDKAINKLAGIIWAPFGERIKKKIQAVALGWLHSIYDMQRSWSVREYAFAQALKQNRVETEEAIKDLLQKVKSWEINNPIYANRWRKIMADTEENYARFFSNANTTALSRHRWSRAFGFNFLQWYVINRADEMTQWIKKMYNFIKERWVKNLTWDDVTYHLAHDNIELKSFLNNIILTTKLWYYLDRVDDYDGSPAKNMLWYFVDANDYLSSLDTLWFMRLFKTIPNWISDYMEYTDYAKQDATVGWALWTVWYELTAEICSQFFREGKFLNAMMQTLIAWMKTWDLDFAATVAWVEWEKMSNWLWRFGLVDWLEKYWLEDFTEPSDIIWSVLFSTNKTSMSGKVQDKMWALANVDKIINDPGYAAVTAVWYLPLIWELIKTATDNWGFNFTEAKYKEMMNMVENDKWLQELYRGKLNTEPYTDEAINRIWSDFTSFNYPAKYEKSPGKHAVWSYIEWKDTTLNSMKEDVFVQNICEKMGITVEELHNMIASDSSKTTGKLKVMAAAEAAEPGSGKIILSYMMANRLYELEKQVTWSKYPSQSDIGDEVMNQLKRIVLEEMWEWMFTADKVSWYKAIREYISIKNPSVFNTLYKNETLSSYVWSIGFLDSLMYDAAQKWDVDAKYIKNAWSVLTKYMKDTDARTSAVEYLFSQAENLNIPASWRHMVMEWILAGNIDFYNTLKNSPALRSIYWPVLRDFEERLWWVLDEVDIIDDSYRTQNKKKTYTPYTSNYWDNNGKVEDDLRRKANQYFPKSSGNWTSYWHRTPYSYTGSSVRPQDTLERYLKYYEGLIKAYSDRLVKSTWKKYPAQWTENITFKTGSNNRWSIKWQQLTFPKHKSKEYRTKVFSNLPGSHW